MTDGGGKYGRLSDTLARFRVHIRAAFQSIYVRGVASLAGANAASQLVVILLTPVITRLYSADEYGVLGVYSSVLALTLVGAGLRYEAAIPLPRSTRAAANLLALSLVSNVAVSVLLGVVVLARGNDIARALGLSQPSILWFVPVGVLLAGIYQSLSHLAIRRSAFGTLARTRLLQSTFQGVVQITVGALGAGAAGLVSGHVVGQSAGVRQLATHVRMIQAHQR